MGGPHSHFRYGRPVRRQLDGQKEAIYPSGRENKRGTSQSEVPRLLRLAPRAGLEPATSRLQVPRFFNRAWTISSPACITCRGGCRALMRLYWTGSAAS